MALVDFTLSNGRRFYSSMGNPFGEKGLSTKLSTSQLPHKIVQPQLSDLFSLSLKAFTYCQHHYLQFDRIPMKNAVEMCSWIFPNNKDEKVFWIDFA